MTKEEYIRKYLALVQQTPIDRDNWDTERLMRFNAIIKDCQNETKRTARGTALGRIGGDDKGPLAYLPRFEGKRAATILKRLESFYR